MAILTRREQMLAAFVLLAFLAGLGVRQWRETRPLAALESASTR